MKIQELLDGIRKNDLVLPEFQREYVWSKDQAKQLFVSLFKEYPVGGVLFWKTDDPPELKNLDDLPDKLGTIQVILDGQQRLTTLYLLVNGDIPPYYQEKDILTNPRDLYFNLAEGDFQYYQATRMRGNPVWIKLTDCFTNREINVFEIAEEVIGEEESESSAFDLANKFNANLNALKNIYNVDLPVQTVPPNASLEEAIDIFDRVNSQGTKLTDADLALTHITGKWAQARRVMKSKIDDLSDANFDFDLTFMTRGLNGVVTNRALFEIIHPIQREPLEAGWNTLSKILDYLVSILPQRAHIHSTQDLNSTNTLIPLAVYLALNDNRFPDEASLKNAIHWLYAAHTWSRYTSQTDQRLELDLSIIVREANPWDALRDQIIDQRGRIEVKSSDLEGRGIQHPLYRMMFILSKAQGAVDWFNGSSLSTSHGDAYAFHNHHVFPSSTLYENDFDPDNHLHRKIVNEIANRVVLTADTNWDLSNKLPEEYFPIVEDKYPGALAKQFIPMDPELWKLARYTEFLEARRALVAIKFNEFMDGLISEPVVVREKTVAELIALGETATLEYKSTLQWDVVQEQVNKSLRHSVLKTIAAFLNTAGGTLVIGVEDNGNVYGLENDLKQMNNSTDKFATTLSSLIVDYIGGEYGALVDAHFEEIESAQVCVIDVDMAPMPAYLKGDRGQEFYIRIGPSSKVLDTEEAHNYISTNWN